MIISAIGGTVALALALNLPIIEWRPATYGELDDTNQRLHLVERRISRRDLKDAERNLKNAQIDIEEYKAKTGQLRPPQWMLDKEISLKDEIREIQLQLNRQRR